MKSKKRFLFSTIFILFICFILIYFFKPMTMNNIHDKPNFIGIVTDVNEKTILVSVNEDEDEFKSSDKIIVSLDVKLKDSMTNFNIGNKVKVFYDGEILESYPAQVKTVYTIFLLNESSTSSNQD